MDRNERVGTTIGDLPRLAVLLVDSSHTYCSLCGGETLPDEQRHDIDFPGAQIEGCHARFIAIAALNRYEDSEANLKQLRPDLPIVEISDAEAHRLQLS